jgi:hypothetical protein
VKDTPFCSCASLSSPIPFLPQNSAAFSADFLTLYHQSLEVFTRVPAFIGFCGMSKTAAGGSNTGKAQACRYVALATREGGF